MVGLVVCSTMKLISSSINDDISSLSWGNHADITNLSTTGGATRGNREPLVWFTRLAIGFFIKLIKSMGIMVTTGFASQKLPCENSGKIIYQTNSADGAEPTTHYPCTCRVLRTQPQRRNNVLLRNRRLSHNSHFLIVYICLLQTVYIYIYIKGRLLGKLSRHGRWSWLAFTPSCPPHRHVNHQVVGKCNNSSGCEFTGENTLGCETLCVFG